jgi:hypothetical protein
VIFLGIDATHYKLAADAPVATLLKHLNNAVRLDFRQLGDQYVQVIGKPVRIEITNHVDHYEVLTEAEFLRRQQALTRALPQQASPDAHGTDIANTEADHYSRRRRKP